MDRTQKVNLSVRRNGLVLYVFSFVPLALSAGWSMLPERWVGTITLPLQALVTVLALLFIVVRGPCANAKTEMVEVILGFTCLASCTIGLGILSYTAVHLMPDANATPMTLMVGGAFWVLLLVAMLTRCSAGLAMVAVVQLGFVGIPFALLFGFGTVRSVNVFWDTTPPRLITSKLAAARQYAGPKRTTYDLVIEGPTPDSFSGTLPVERSTYEKFHAPQSVVVAIGPGRLGFPYIKEVRPAALH